MTSTFANRRTAGIISVALALGIAAPAGAKPFDLNQQGSEVPAGSAQVQAQSLPATTRHTTSGGISDWGYVAIGSGAASLALIGIGGTRVAGRRRQQRITAQQPTIAT
jgi:hypothetical protein